MGQVCGLLRFMNPHFRRRGVSGIRKMKSSELSIYLSDLELLKQLCELMDPCDSSSVDQYEQFVAMQFSNQYQNWPAQLDRWLLQYGGIDKQVDRLREKLQSSPWEPSWALQRLLHSIRHLFHHYKSSVNDPDFQRVFKLPLETDRAEIESCIARYFFEVFPSLQSDLRVIREESSRLKASQYDTDYHEYFKSPELHQAVLKGDQKRAHLILERCGFFVARYKNCYGKTAAVVGESEYPDSKLAKELRTQSLASSDLAAPFESVEIVIH